MPEPEVGPDPAVRHLPVHPLLEAIPRILVTPIPQNEGTMDTAERIVAEAAEALRAIDADIARARSDKLGLNQNIADLIEQRKPLSRIVNAAKGRNGHGTPGPQ
jgi:hypothetical protein